MSAITLGRGPGAAAALNVPVSSVSAMPAKANAAADPMNASYRLLALESWSRSTIEGMTDWAAVSNSVSPMPRANAAM